MRRLTAARALIGLNKISPFEKKKISGYLALLVRDRRFDKPRNNTIFWRRIRRKHLRPTKNNKYKFSPKKLYKYINHWSKYKRLKLLLGAFLHKKNLFRKFKFVSLDKLSVKFGGPYTPNMLRRRKKKRSRPIHPITTAHRTRM